MHPLLTTLRIGSIERPLGSYGAMLSLALLLGGALAVRAAVRRVGLDAASATAAVLTAAVGGYAGGHLAFLVVETLRPGGDPLLALQHPGLVFYGAPFGALLALVALRRPLSLPLLVLLDATTPAIPLAHAIGRLGCFLGGCCYGRPWDGPWAVVATHPLAPAAHPAVPRHPVALYESGGLLLIALGLTLHPPRRLGNGRRLALYGLLYSLLRVLTEHLRGDAVRGLFFGGILSTSTALSGLLLVTCAVYLWRTRWHARSGSSSLPCSP